MRGNLIVLPLQNARYDFMDISEIVTELEKDQVCHRAMQYHNPILRFVRHLIIEYFTCH